ncbi:hypothetical protein GCM10027343_16760 [Noviherbaspirillum agri]
MNKEEKAFLKAFPSDRPLAPTILGRRFRIADDPEIYAVMGIVGREFRIVLQSESTEEIRYLSKTDFLKLAKRVEE